MNLGLTARGQDHDIQNVKDPEAINLNFEALYREVQRLYAALNSYQVNLGTDVTGILPASGLGAGVPPSTSKFYREDGIFAPVVTGGGGMPQAGFRRLGWTQTLDGVVLDIGGATTIAGPSAFVKDAQGLWRRMTVAASISSSVSWGSNNNVAYLDHKPIVQFRFRLGPTITNIRLWAGLTAGTPVDSDALSSIGIAFRYSTVAGDMGFVPVSKSSTASTPGTPVGTVTASGNYMLEIQVLDPATATFNVYSGLPLVLVDTTTIPIPPTALNTALSWSIILYTRDAVAKVIDFTRVYYEAS